VPSLFTLIFSFEVSSSVQNAMRPVIGFSADGLLGSPFVRLAQFASTPPLPMPVGEVSRPSRST
jgi:hypothetical protein